MWKKFIKVIAALVIIVSAKNCLEAVSPDMVGKCQRNPSQLRESQTVTDGLDLRLFKILFSGSAVWKDSISGEYYQNYYYRKGLRCTQDVSTKIRWNKNGKFNVYSFFNSQEKSFVGERVCLLFYDKTNFEIPISNSAKYDVIAIRLPEKFSDLSSRQDCFCLENGDYIDKFVNQHISSNKMYGCVMNDEWMIFFSINFCKNHPNHILVDNFKESLDNLIDLLYDNQYDLLSSTMFYACNDKDIKLTQKRSLL